MTGFILAAGYGTRLRPLTDNLPKPLVPVCGIPALAYSVALLKEAGVSRVICNLHYLPSMIRDFFSRNNEFGLDIEFSYEEEILGTGGALKRCENLLSGTPFYLVNSDVITDLSLITLERAGSPVIALTPFSGAKTVSLRDGMAADFKGVLGSGIPPLYDYAGIALLDNSVFPYLSAEHSSVVYTGYTGLISGAGLRCAVHEGLWGDIGSQQALQSIEEKAGKNRRLLERIGDYTGLKADC